MKTLNNIFTLSIIFVLAATIMGSCKSNQPTADTTLIKLLNDKKTFVVDVRTPEEFSEGSIKRAVNIPHTKIENNLDQFKDKKQIVVFCRSGKRAETAKTALEKNGFTNVTNAGGYEQVKNLLENNK